MLGYDGLLGPDHRLDQALSANLAAAAAAVLRLAGWVAGPAPTNARLLVLGGQPAVVVGDPCNGLLLYTLFAGFVLAFLGPGRHKLWLIPLGIFVGARAQPGGGAWWGRRWRGGLLSLGLFEADVFAVLGQLWHPGGAPVAVPGLTAHGLPVAISYRLFYALLNLALVRLLLRGRFTKAVGAGYAVGYVLSVGLLVLGQRAALPVAAIAAHRVLDVLSSPLPVLFALPLALLSRRGPGA